MRPPGRMGAGVPPSREALPVVYRIAISSTVSRLLNLDKEEAFDTVEAAAVAARHMLECQRITSSAGPAWDTWSVLYRVSEWQTWRVIATGQVEMSQ